MPLPAHEHKDDFLTETDRLLSDPSGEFQVRVKDLLAHFADRQVTELATAILGKKNWLIGEAISSSINPTVGGVLSHLMASAKEADADRKRKRIKSIAYSYCLSRPTVALSEKEKGLIRGMAALHADDQLDDTAWHRFLGELIWAGGKATFVPDPGDANDKSEPDARQFLTTLLRALIQPYDLFIEQSAARLARERHNGKTSGRAIAAFLSQGASWLDDDGLLATATYSFEASAPSLLLGQSSDSDRTIYYDGNESLITIAAPGTGKSQVQVIPNLLRYRGSAFVLDVKGELWEATAAHRRAEFGPTIRFAPTDPTGDTDCFNPFDFVDPDPQQAITDCELFSHQIIPANPNLKDPYWEGRARDFLCAFAAATALDAKPETRNLASVMELLSVPTNFEDASDSAYLRSPTAKVVDLLERLAKRHAMPTLSQVAVSIESGLGETRLESIFDTARRHLNIFARSALLRHAMSRSDWHPIDLKRHPGTTVYLCLSGDDIEAYMPVVRIILQQHANLLLRDFNPAPGAPPITFFLDEMPQLGYMESLQRLLDVGRGAGLRLWLFAQYMGQLRAIYGQRAEGLINACRVRCFMQPDNEAVRFLSPQLGTTRNLFTGEVRPLAEPHDLMGPAFADFTITTARGEAPLKLAKRYAWQNQEIGNTGTPPFPPRPSQSRDWSNRPW